jgi:RND family efflux transporter MFP subunit
MLPRLFVPGLFLLSIVIAVILVLTKPQAKTADAREVARTIDTLTVDTGSFAPTVPVFVRVTTPNHASLRAAVTADVMQLLALDGTVVDAGQMIMLLDDREAALAVKQREADLQEASSQIDAENLQHENELYVIRNDKGESAKHNREQIIKSHKIRLQGLQAKKLRASSALELAKLDLQRTQIKAPFAGQITAVHVSVGDRVRPGDKLIDLYDREAIELTGSIPARYLPSIQSALSNKHGLSAIGIVNGQPVTAMLERLSGEVNAGSGGVNAIFSLSNKNGSLQLGRSLKLDLKLPPVDNAVVIPNTALYGMDTIYKVSDRRLKSVPVSRRGDYPDRDGIPHSVIASPHINSGDIIMTTQLPNAVENLLVNPASSQ